MSHKYKLKDPKAIYFVSFATGYWDDIFILPVYEIEAQARP
jgi:hypothetical protein